MRSSPLRTTLLVAATLVTAGAADLAAQTEIEILPRAATVTLGGRLHVQAQGSTVEGSVADLFIRRARLRLDVRISDFLDGRLNPEFSGGTATLQDAWVRMRFAPSFRVSLGQFKRAFSLFELASSTDLPVIERDGRIAGLDSCPGVGGTCSFSRLTQKLGFDGRDQGVRVDGALGEGLSYLVTATNGEGVNVGDANDGKSVAGRLQVTAGPFGIGAFASLKDYPVSGDGPEPEGEYAWAGGADLEYGTWRDGLHVMGAVSMGQNWRAGEDSEFRTVQLLASYYVPTGDPTYGGVEPLLRAAWSEPDTEVADNAGFLLTPGLMVYFTGKNGVSANLDAWIPTGDGDTELSFKLQSFLYF